MLKIEDIDNIKKRIKQDIIDSLSSNEENNIKLIKKFVDDNGGKYILTPNNDIVYLVGASSTNEDYYYVVINKRLKVEFITCVGHVEVIDFESFKSEDLYLLDYTVKNNPEHLVNIIKTAINKNIDVLFTNIYINNTIYD